MKTKATIIVWLLYFLAGCSLKAVNSTNNQSPQETPPQEINPQGTIVLQNTSSQNLTGTLSYGVNGYEEAIEFVFNHQTQQYSLQNPIVLPMNLPDTINFKYPTNTLHNLSGQSFGHFGSLRRAFHLDLDATVATDNPNSITINAQISQISGSFPNQNGTEGVIFLHAQNNNEEKRFEFKFKAPPVLPNLTEVEVPNRNASPLQINSTIQVVPLRTFEVLNNTIHDLFVEFPRFPQGILKHKTLSTTYTQGDCTVIQNQTTQLIDVSDRFLLVQEGTSSVEINALLGANTSSTIKTPLTHGGNTSYILYSLHPSNLRHPRLLGRSITGPNQLLSPGCHNGPCRRLAVTHTYYEAYYYGRNPQNKSRLWSCNPRPGFYAVPTDRSEFHKFQLTQNVDCQRDGTCSYNGQNPTEVTHSACVDYFQDLDDNIVFNNFTDVLGVAITADNFLNNSRSYFINLPLNHPDHATLFPIYQSPTLLEGQGPF